MRHALNAMYKNKQQTANSKVEEEELKDRVIEEEKKRKQL